MKRIILIAVMVLAFWVGAATAHEGGPNGVQHLTQGSGRLIGQRTCNTFTVWYHDDDGDHKVDRCSGAFLYHETIHIFPVKTQVIKDYRDRAVMDCSCEPVITDVGGAL